MRPRNMAPQDGYEKLTLTEHQPQYEPLPALFDAK